MYLNKRRTFVLALTCFCFIGILTTLGLMINWKKDIKTNTQVKQSMEKFLVTDKQEDIDTGIEVDFEELRKINPDTVGYLEVPNTNVQFVVVKGNDNSYYLTHNFNKDKNAAGWIFMDYNNKADGTDKNIVIFGHNTTDGSMFGSLSKLLDENNLKDKENLIISLVTDKGTKKYQIFSIYTIKPEKYYIRTDYGEEEFIKFKEKIKERSLFKLDADLDNKNILTLSTCQNHGAKRLAIHAVEI